ncbi:Phosphoglycolate phosphatase [Thalassocella blandensis]|nr:Phosphoglycolate phosphatase [Thalassocella blandensis]
MFFIFDWDGTLSNSAAKIVSCMQQAARDIAIDARDDAAIRNIIGLGLPEAILALYPELGEHERQNLRDSYADHFVRNDVTPSPFFPGVMQTLEALKAQGFLLAVATGKSRKGLDRVLQNLDMEDFFHGSRCADETASKPHPLMLNELLTEFDVAVDQAVMIGDTEYDMAMAAELGMPRIAVSYGAHHIDRLKTYAPAMCIDDFSQILEWQFK